VSVSLSYEFTIAAPTIDKVYRDWVANRKPPLFGVEPDVRVWALSVEAQCPVLEIGAGTGRNVLALAGRGHPVDVVEITSAFDVDFDERRSTCADWSIEGQRQRNGEAGPGGCARRPNRQARCGDDRDILWQVGGG